MSEELEKNKQGVQVQNAQTNIKPETRKVLVEDTNEIDDTDEYEDEYDDEEYEDDDYYDEQEETDQIREIASKGSKKNHNKFAVVKDKFGNIYVEDRKAKIRRKNILYISVGFGVLSLVASAYLGAMLLTKKDMPSGSQTNVFPDLKTREELDVYFNNKVNIVPASATNSPELMRTNEQLAEEVIVTKHEPATLDESAIIRLGLATADFRDKPKNVSFKYKVDKMVWSGPGVAQEYELSIWAFIPKPADVEPSARTTAPVMIQSSRKIYSLFSSDLNQDVITTTQAQLDDYVSSLSIAKIASITNKELDLPWESNIFDTAAQEHFGVEVVTALNKPIDVHLEFELEKGVGLANTKRDYTIKVIGKTTAGLTSSNEVEGSFKTSDNYHTSQQELNDYIDSVKSAFTVPSLTFQELDTFVATDELFNQAAITKLKLVGSLPSKPSDIVLTYSFFKGTPASNGAHQNYTLQIFGNVMVTGDTDPREVSAINIAYTSSNVVHNNSGLIATEFGKFFTALNGNPTIVTTYSEDTITTLPQVGIVQASDLFTTTYTPSTGVTAKFEVKSRTSSSVTVDITLSIGTGVDLATDTKTLVITYSKLQASVADDNILAAKAALAALNNTKSTLTNANFTETSADKTNYSSRLGISSISALTNVTTASFTIANSTSPKFARNITVILNSNDSSLSLSDRTVTFTLYAADKNALDVADEKTYFESQTSTSNTFTDSIITELPSLGAHQDASNILGNGYTISNPFVNVTYEVTSASGHEATVRITFTSKNTDPVATLEKTLTITYDGIRDAGAAATARLEAANNYLLALNQTTSTNDFASFTVNEIINQEDYSDKLGINATKLIDELTNASFKVKSKNATDSTIVIEFTLTMDGATPSTKTGEFTLHSSDKFAKEVNDEKVAFETATSITGTTFDELTIATLPTEGIKTDYSTLFTLATPYTPGELVVVEYAVEAVNAQNATADIKIRFVHKESDLIFQEKTITITYVKIAQASGASAKVNAVRNALQAGSSIISTNNWDSFDTMTSANASNVAVLGLSAAATTALAGLTNYSITIANDDTPGSTYKKDITITMVMDGFEGGEDLLSLSFTLVAKDKNNNDFDDETVNFANAVTSENTFDENTITTLPTTSTTDLDEIITNTYTPGTKVDVTYEITNASGVNATLVVTFTNKANPTLTLNKTISITYTKIRESRANADVASAKALFVHKTSLLNHEQIVAGDYTLADDYASNLGIDEFTSIDALTYIEGVEFSVHDNKDYSYQVSYTIVSQFASADKTGIFVIDAADKASYDAAQAKIDAEKELFMTAIGYSEADGWVYNESTITTVPDASETDVTKIFSAPYSASEGITVGYTVQPVDGNPQSVEVIVDFSEVDFPAASGSFMFTITYAIAVEVPSAVDNEKAAFETAITSGTTYNENTITTLPTALTTNLAEIITTSYAPGSLVTTTYAITNASGYSATLTVTFTDNADPTSTATKTITITYTKIRESLANDAVVAAKVVLIDMTSNLTDIEIVDGPCNLSEYTTALGVSPIVELMSPYVEGIIFTVTSNNDGTFNVAYTITSQYATVEKTGSFVLTAAPAP